ncbi:Protein of unknown function [Arthrobacter subterraneus]|uniref:DUF3043 domain-containing protein n=1 Tax=Arthrobacter subterraneus TaxID=335973 RepID=A0A1G8ESI8_9MICC|nr:DUF3043 domain-containing protein [Arthrobacter subterraneus]SDH72807.1 Protein of unknown function [Arthrobacter subterraneus]
MFGRKKDAALAENPTAPAADDARPKVTGKGAPTPKRSAQVAARKRPLVPNDRKAAREANRLARREEQLRMRRALENGDERHLPFRDKGPARRYVRDYVDARWNVAEFLMFAALVFVFLSFIPNLTLQGYIMLTFWVIIVAVVMDCLLLRRKLKARLTEKFGEPGRGDLWYGISRAMQIRRLRLPKPQVGRGKFPA